VYVVVGGDGWSNAEHFEQFNGPRAWVRDPVNRVVYEAHCYFDADASGKYTRSFASELHDDPQLASRGAKRMRAFVEWCKRNGVPGFIGEYGIPGNNPGWQGVLAGALEVIARSGAASCYWAAGEWWKDYPLSIQPRNEMRQPAPQQQLVLDYLGPRAQSKEQTTVPARSSRDRPS
jgi:endoglucanase